MTSLTCVIENKRNVLNVEHQIEKKHSKTLIAKPDHPSSHAPIKTETHKHLTHSHTQHTDLHTHTCTQTVAKGTMVWDEDLK